MFISSLSIVGAKGDLRLGYKTNQHEPFPRKVDGVEGVSGFYAVAYGENEGPG